MKHLKRFENLNEPKMRDWVYVKPNKQRFGLSKEWREWMRTHLGQIVYIDEDRRRKLNKIYQVQYETNSGFEEMRTTREEIVEFSENKEDLEYILQANIYNL